MWNATIKGLLSHKLRLALTALAIVLGVSFVSGTYVLTDTMNATFSQLFKDTTKGIDVVAQPGVTPEQLRDRVAGAVPGKYESITGADQAQRSAKEIQDGLGFFSTALLAFAGVALFVGAFLIFNTFSIIVAQRTRELALLRCLGASRRQVLGSVLLESG